MVECEFVAFAAAIEVGIAPRTVGDAKARGEAVVAGDLWAVNVPS